MTAPDPMTRKENIMNSRIKRIFTLSLAFLLAVILACGAAAYTNLAKNGDASLGYYEDEDENGFTAEKGKTFLQSVYAPTFTPASGG